MHGLLELLLVEELEDEEDELAAERRHGGGGDPVLDPRAPELGWRPPGTEGRGLVVVAVPPGRPRILGFRRRPPLFSRERGGGEREAEMWKRVGEGEREKL